MLVDDSQDLLDFLREALTGEFTEIITATSGNKALTILNNGKLPDIIVSDVNMPDGDGYRLCSALKGNDRYSHIPIVLLTARGDGQSQIDSYKAGADAFMAKPFEVDTLLELLKGMLRKKKEIKKKYLDNEGVLTSEYGSNEEGFIIRLNKIISDNLSNPDLDQILLCREMGLSRASLFNKMKSITGTGAKEYITRIRIEKAKSLMENTDMSIAEIADKTGFASQSYFSTAFKTSTGLTPSQYKQQNKKR
jgi:YesN/AraC family two-component response regulator